MFQISRCRREPRPPDQGSAASARSEYAPAHLLHGRQAIGPDGETLGAVSLVVRRDDGARVVVVHRRSPNSGPLVLRLAGSSIDGAGFLHVAPGAQTDVVGASPGERSPDAGRSAAVPVGHHDLAP